MGIYSMNRETLWYALALVVIGFSLYAADLNNTFIFDDDHFILENTTIREISWAHAEVWFTENAYAGSQRKSDYYRPLLIASFALNYMVDGERTFGYHLVNNLLHVGNGLLVFWLMLYGFKRKTLAFLVALVFLIHPMQSEGVAFVAGRGDLMSSLFMLLGLMAWLRGLESGRRVLVYGVSSVCLVLALLSRENAIVFPFLAIVAYIAFVSRETFWEALRQAVYKVLPHLGIVAGYLALRLTVLNFRDFLNFGNVGHDALYYQDIVVRLYTFMHVLLEYVRTFFWPTTVHERLTFPIHTTFFDVLVWPIFLCVLTLFCVLVWLYREKKSDFRIWFFAVGWFFVALVPASGIIPTNVIIQDHRLYLAMIGVAVLCFHYLSRGMTYASTHGVGWLRFPILGALVLYLCFFAFLTIKRTIIWGKPVELFEETIRYEPDALNAYNSLGIHYYRLGEYEKAAKNYFEAIRRGTKSPLPYYNVGLLYEFRDPPDREKAIEFYKKALQLDPTYWRATQHIEVLERLK
jgi:protein O-mannosyl-transferase